MSIGREITKNQLHAQLRIASSEGLTFHQFTEKMEAMGFGLPVGCDKGPHSYWDAKIKSYRANLNITKKLAKESGDADLVRDLTAKLASLTLRSAGSGRRGRMAMSADEKLAKRLEALADAEDYANCMITSVSLSQLGVPVADDDIDTADVIIDADETI